MIWKPGDHAILVQVPNIIVDDGCEVYFGEEVILVQRVFYVHAENIDWKIDTSGKTLYCNEIVLRPIPPKPEKASWEDCVWKPQALEETK